MNDTNTIIERGLNHSIIKWNDFSLLSPSIRALMACCSKVSLLFSIKSESVDSGSIEFSRLGWDFFSGRISPYWERLVVAGVVLTLPFSAVELICCERVLWTVVEATSILLLICAVLPFWVRHSFVSISGITRVSSFFCLL